MSEPSTAKPVASGGNGRTKALSEEQENIKAGENMAKAAAASSAKSAPAEKKARKMETTKVTAPGFEAMKMAGPDVTAWVATWQSNNDELLNRFREAAQEAYGAMESSNATFLDTATQIQKKTMDFLQSQMNDSTEYVRALTEVKNPAEVMKLNQDYAAGMMKCCTEQMEEFRSLWTEAAKTGLGPMGEGAEFFKKWTQTK